MLDNLQMLLHCASWYDHGLDYEVVLTKCQSLLLRVVSSASAHSELGRHFDYIEGWANT